MLKTILAAAAWALSVGVLAAQEAPVAASVGDEPGMVVVEGLARDDLLNVRATASPAGVVLGRLPNGSLLRNLGCTEVKGYRWCQVEAIGDASLAGWTPGRYLQPSGEADPAAGPFEPPADQLETAEAAPPGTDSAAAGMPARRDDPPAADRPRDEAASAEPPSSWQPGQVGEAVEHLLAQPAVGDADIIDGGERVQRLPPPDLSARPWDTGQTIAAAEEPQAPKPTGQPRPRSAAGPAPALQPAASTRDDEKLNARSDGQAAKAARQAAAALPPSRPVRAETPKSRPAAESARPETPAPAARPAAPPPAISTAALQSPDPMPRSATVSAGRAAFPIASPMLLTLGTFSAAFMAFMTAILSFGSLSFSSPFESSGLAA